MDVIARWRDAVNDPPPDGWRGLVSRDRRHEIVRWAYYDDSYKCFRDERHDKIDSTAYWLDITDEPAVPRAKVQAAVDEIRDTRAHDYAVEIIAHHTGITPTEATLEPCKQCGGTGVIAYNPNLNPNAFPATTTAKCGKCGGTGITPTEFTGTSVDRVLTEIEVDQYLSHGVTPTEG